jgi:hypothetical protein
VINFTYPGMNAGSVRVFVPPLAAHRSVGVPAHGCCSDRFWTGTPCLSVSRLENAASPMRLTLTQHRVNLLDAASAGGRLTQQVLQPGRTVTITGQESEALLTGTLHQGTDHTPSFRQARGANPSLAGRPGSLRETGSELHRTENPCDIRFFAEGDVVTHLPHMSNSTAHLSRTQQQCHRVSRH